MIKRIFLVVFFTSSLLFATIPSKPTLVLPTANQTEVAISSYTFKWNTSTGTPTSYHIQISQISTFGYFAIIDSTHSDTTKTVTTLTANTKYFWRVRSKNGSGISAWSDVRSFTTNTTLPIHPVFSAGNGTNEKFFRIGLNAGWIFWNNADSSYYRIIGNDTSKVGGVDLNADYTWRGKHTFKNVTTFDSTMYLANNQFFGSKSFVSGWAGSGWKLDYGLTEALKSSGELDNLTVRGRLAVYELLVRQIRATNGAVFVTASAKVSSVAGTTVTFEDPSYTGSTYMCPFAVHDLLIVQRYRPDGTTSIKLSKATVSSVSGASIVVSWDSGTFAKGDEVVRVGNTTDATRQNSIYLTSDDSNSPFIDMITGVDSWTAWASATKTKLRIGNLTGITDAAFGGALSGYGIYAQNIYLKGAIQITNPTTFVNGDSLNIDNVKNGTTYGKTIYTDIVGAKRAYTGLNSSNALVTAVLPATNIGTPTYTGLYLGADKLGYYQTTGTPGWKTYMDNSGNFYLTGSTTDHGVSWNAGTDVLTVAGAGIVSSNIRQGMTSYTDRTHLGYFLGLNSTTPVFRMQLADTSKYFDYTGSLLNLKGVNIVSPVITGGTIQTAASGARTVLDASGIKIYSTGKTSTTAVKWDVLGSTVFSIGVTTSGLGEYGGSYMDVGSYLTLDGFFIANGLNTTGYKFVVDGSSGQITKVNNISPTSGYALIGDGTSFTPTNLFGGAHTWTAAQTINTDLKATRTNFTSITSNTIDVSGKTFIRIKTTGAATINTINGGAEGKVVYVSIGDGGDITFGVTGNIVTSTGSAVVAPANGMAILLYDDVDAAWHIMVTP